MEEEEKAVMSTKETIHNMLKKRNEERKFGTLHTELIDDEIV